MNAYSGVNEGETAKRLYDVEMAKRHVAGEQKEGQPRIAVVYTYPLGMSAYDDAARRFVSTYREYPPLQDHTLHVVLNGEGARDEHRALFGEVRCEFHEHDNTGWDIGAFQQIARQIDCDMLVCFGAFTHFKREGWLRRMREAFVQCGPGLYGASASYWFTPHIRTAGFWCHPELIRAYPKDVRTFDERYEFEHGSTSITSLAGHLDLGIWMVTWDGVYAEDEWRTPPDIFWRGDQSNSLYYDRRFEEYEEHPSVKPLFAAAADGWEDDPRGQWRGKTQAEWAGQSGARDAKLADPWGLIARQVLADLRATARTGREVASIEDEFVAELARDQLTWVRNAIIDRVGIPEELLVWPDVAAAAIHSALRMNAFSGEPYNERRLGADWSVSEDMQLKAVRRRLLLALQPFIDRQRRADILMSVLLTLTQDETRWLESRVALLDES